MPAPCTPWLTEPQAPGVTLELGGPQASALLQALWEEAGWYLPFTLAGFPLLFAGGRGHLIIVGGLIEGQVSDYLVAMCVSCLEGGS